MELSRKYGMMLIILCLGIKATAQIPGPLGELLDKIRRHSGAYMAYDYEIRLKRLSDGKITDSVRGHLCNAPNHYRDSNTVFFTARAGDYYCKLNHKKKTATVYDLKQLSQQVKFNLETPAADPYGISEALTDPGTRVRVDTSDKRLYRLVCQFADRKLRSLQLDLKREDYSLTAATFETLEENDPEDKDPYVRIYRLYRVQQHKDAPLPDLGGIFRLEQGKILLSKAYANYTLNELPR